MPAAFELINGGLDNPEYRRQIADHLAAVATYNVRDYELYQAGFWNPLLERPEREWRSPDYHPAILNERLEMAWDLAEQGHKLCLAGIISIFGGQDGIGYTPIRVDWRSHFPEGAFEDERQRAVNYQALPKPVLYLVS